MGILNDYFVKVKIIVLLVIIEFECFLRFVILFMLEIIIGVNIDFVFVFKVVKLNLMIGLFILMF